jgi:hypothetical protein
MVYKLSRAGYHFAETPVHHYPRLHGQSQFFTLRRVARTGYDFFRLWLKLVIFSTQGRTEEEAEKRRHQSKRRREIEKFHPAFNSNGQMMKLRKGTRCEREKQ